jgi:hypothetical protein
VIITGAFFAEHAEAVDNTLNVTHGVLEYYTVGATREVRVFLVLLTQRPTDETNSELEIKVTPPIQGAEPLIIRGPLPEAPGELGFVVFGIHTGLPVDGRSVFEVSAGDNTVSLPLTIRQSG